MMLNGRDNAVKGYISWEVVIDLMRAVLLAAVIYFPCLVGSFFAIFSTINWKFTPRRRWTESGKPK
jgi:hypothetical protein